MATKDTFWRTLGIAVASMIVWAIVAGFFASKAYGQDTTYVVQPIPVILVDGLPNGDIGTVVCDTFSNKPVAMVDRHTIGTRSFAETVMHEMVHISQVLNHPSGCRGALLDFKLTPSTRLAWEGEAYCRMYETYYTGNELQAKLDALPSLLYYRHSLFPLTFQAVKKRVNAMCGQAKIARSP